MSIKVISLAIFASITFANISYGDVCLCYTMASEDDARCHKLFRRDGKIDAKECEKLCKQWPGEVIPQGSKHSCREYDPGYEEVQLDNTPANK